MATPALLACAVIAVLNPLGAAQPDDGNRDGIPSFTVCGSDEFWNAMEQTCASSLLPSLTPLYAGVTSLEEFDKLCCSNPCSMRYFVHLCLYPADQRHQMAFNGERRRRSLRRRSKKLRG